MELTRADIETLKETGYVDPVFFCRIMLPLWFPQEIPWVHRGILAILTRKTDFLLKYGELDLIERWFVADERPGEADSPKIPIFIVDRDSAGNATAVHLFIRRFTLIMMPRGFSKTTLLNAVHLYFMLYKVKMFSFYLSETATHSETQLGNVKRELETNENIRAVYGNLVPAGASNKTWRGNRIELANDAVMACTGRGGQVRGQNIAARRPDSIVLDDVEDKESVKTDEQRAKTLEWFFADVIPALPEMNPDATITALGTLLHRDALLARLRADPEWTTVVFGAQLEDGSMLWPRNMDEAKLLARKASYARAGKLATFYMEYLNRYRAEETMRFKPEYIQYGMPPNYTNMQTAIAWDPAISEKETACEASIVVAGMTEQGKIVILDVWGEVGASPRAQIDQFFKMARRWKCREHGIESIGFQAALIHLVREEMFRKKYYFEPVPITHGERKDLRINGVLQPRYAARYVWHRLTFPELEAQLFDFPAGKVDRIDAAAMAVTLLDPFAAHAADPKKDLGDDEYESLEAILPDWRAM